MSVRRHNPNDTRAHAAGLTLDERVAPAAELARIEIARAESLGAMSDTAKLALASAPNAAALADYLKTQVHAGMSADQLAALSGVVAAAHGLTADAARSQLEREREQLASYITG